MFIINSLKREIKKLSNTEKILNEKFKPTINYKNFMLNDDILLIIMLYSTPKILYNLILTNLQALNLFCRYRANPKMWYENNFWQYPKFATFLKKYVSDSYTKNGFKKSLCQHSEVIYDFIEEMSKKILDGKKINALCTTFNEFSYQLKILVNIINQHANLRENKIILASILYLIEKNKYIKTLTEVNQFIDNKNMDLKKHDASFLLSSQIIEEFAKRFISSANRRNILKECWQLLLKEFLKIAKQSFIKNEMFFADLTKTHDLILEQLPNPRLVRINPAFYLFYLENSKLYKNKASTIKNTVGYFLKNNKSFCELFNYQSGSSRLQISQYFFNYIYSNNELTKLLFEQHYNFFKILLTSNSKHDWLNAGYNIFSSCIDSDITRFHDEKFCNYVINHNLALKLYEDTNSGRPLLYYLLSNYCSKLLLHYVNNKSEYKIDIHNNDLVKNKELYSHMIKNYLLEKSINSDNSAKDYFIWLYKNETKRVQQALDEIFDNEDQQEKLFENNPQLLPKIVLFTLENNSYTNTWVFDNLISYYESSINEAHRNNIEKFRKNFNNFITSLINDDNKGFFSKPYNLAQLILSIDHKKELEEIVTKTKLKKVYNQAKHIAKNSTLEALPDITETSLKSQYSPELYNKTQNLANLMLFFSKQKGNQQTALKMVEDFTKKVTEQLAYNNEKQKEAQKNDQDNHVPTIKQLKL